MVQEYERAVIFRLGRYSLNLSSFNLVHLVFDSFVAQGSGFILDIQNTKNEYELMANLPKV